jgi:hypothetical protein
VGIREGEMEMRTGRSRSGCWKGEFRIGAMLLSLYALTLLISDPGWATWAGGMAMGALPILDTPPPLPFTPNELFAGAGVLGLLALGTFVAIFLLLGGNACDRLLALWEREIMKWWHGDLPGRL